MKPARGFSEILATVLAMEKPQGNWKRCLVAFIKTD